MVITCIALSENLTIVANHAIHPASLSDLRRIDSDSEHHVRLPRVVRRCASFVPVVVQPGGVPDGDGKSLGFAPTRRIDLVLPWRCASRHDQPTAVLGADLFVGSGVDCDGGLASSRSATQLPRPILPIRCRMSPARRTAHGLPLAVAVASCAAAAPLRAQLASARPASVSLTVVVPPHEQTDRAVASEGAVTLLARTPNTVDLETIVRLTNRATRRVEVRLAPIWPSDSGRVWIRNQRGELVPLVSGGPAVVLDAPSVGIGTSSPLRLRVESSRLLERSLIVPLEYRVKVGSGDEFSIWSFPSVLRLAP